MKLLAALPAAQRQDFPGLGLRKHDKPLKMKSKVDKAAKLSW
jgi:hypothetical protein